MRLSQQDYYELDEQYSITPGVSDGWMASGEHYKLQSLLNRLGYFPHSREEAIETAEKLLSEGYEYVPEE